jgi:hypothetical protein
MFPSPHLFGTQCAAFAAAFMLTALAVPAHAWGPKGHAIIARTRAERSKLAANRKFATSWIRRGADARVKMNVDAA